MTEATLYTLGAVSLAGPLWAVNAWLERRTGKWTRSAIARRLALRLMAYAASRDAAEKAWAEAMKQRIELV